MRKTETQILKHTNASNPNEIGKDTQQDTLKRVNNKNQTEWLNEQVRDNRLRRDKEKQVELHHERFERDRILQEESLNNKFLVDKQGLVKDIQKQNLAMAEEKRRKAQEDKNIARNNDLVACINAQVEQKVDQANKADSKTSNEYLSLPRN